MRRRQISSLCFALALCGCAQPFIEPNRAREATPSTLTGADDKLSVGVLYSWQDRYPYKALDLVSSKIINERFGKIQNRSAEDPRRITIAEPRVGARPGICGPRSRWKDSVPEWLCQPRSVVKVELITGPVVLSEFTDPFTFLELLNRPVTGLAYNLEAESRIMQWRTAVASAIGGSTKDGLSLCIGLEVLRGGAIDITGETTEEESLQLARDAAAKFGFQLSGGSKIEPVADGVVRFSYDFTANKLIKASFRDVSFVQGSTGPRIDFTLQGARSISLF